MLDNQKIITVKCDAKTYVKIDDLEWFQDDLKEINPDDLQALKKSIIDHGILSPFFVWDNEEKLNIIDGHHRVMALKIIRDDGYLLPDLPVVKIYAETKKQAAEQLLILNSVYAKVTDSGLSTFLINNQIDLEFLNHIKIPSIDMSLIGEYVNNNNSNNNLNSENNSDSSNNDENFYSDKIQTPIYEPTGEKPSINELINLDKYKSLCSEIEKSNLSNEEKEFLLFSASRHIVFNYEKIANYYAHSGKNTQELFENSALVIIDFNKAIENGFVKLSNEMNESYINNANEEESE